MSWTRGNELDPDERAGPAGMSWTCTNELGLHEWAGPGPELDPHEFSEFVPPAAEKRSRLDLRHRSLERQCWLYNLRRCSSRHFVFLLDLVAAYTVDGPVAFGAKRNASWASAISTANF